jgi:hypothetical protein
MAGQDISQQKMGSVPNSFQGRGFGQHSHQNSGNSRIPCSSQPNHHTCEQSISTRRHRARPELQAQITPSVASSSNISSITPVTGTPEARTYQWTHVITINLAHTSAVPHATARALTIKMMPQRRTKWGGHVHLLTSHPRTRRRSG